MKFNNFYKMNLFLIFFILIFSSCFSQTLKTKDDPKNLDKFYQATLIVGESSFSSNLK